MYHDLHTNNMLETAIFCYLPEKNPRQRLIIRDLLDSSFVFSDPPGIFTQTVYNFDNELLSKLLKSYRNDFQNVDLSAYDTDVSA